MGFLKKLSELPGVGVPLEEDGGSRMGGGKESGQFSQACQVIVADLKTRAANEAIKGYQSIISPPRNELTEEEMFQKQEKKQRRKERNKKAAIIAGQTGGRVVDALVGLAIGAGRRRRAARLSSGSMNGGGDVVEGKYRVIDNYPELGDGK